MCVCVFSFALKLTRVHVIQYWGQAIRPVFGKDLGYDMISRPLLLGIARPENPWSGPHQPLSSPSIAALRPYPQITQPEPETLRSKS